jgi:ABC-2 type transport system permease protein
MERVGKKSFILTTILMPIVVLLLMMIPACIMVFSETSHKVILVSDQSGVVMPVLKNATEEFLTFVDSNDASADSLQHSEDYYGTLSIPADIVDKPSSAILFQIESGSVETEVAISHLIENAVRDQRMRAYDIDNLQQILDETNVEVQLQTVRVDSSGKEENTSSAFAFGVGETMSFILYMFLLIYGQLVMTSIIEEKNNRVLELVVSSVKPIHLMMGKIIGVALVAVVQLLIWAVLLCMMAGLLIPAILPDDISQQIAMVNAGSIPTGTESIDSNFLTILAQLTSVSYIATMFLYIILFLVGGFLFYASIFAAIGSAVDNIQDASQLTMVATVPVIIGTFIGMAAGTDPNSALAFWSSIIPITAPMVMLMRIPFGIPSWQIWLSLVLLYASFIGMVWIAAKIYRIGIFMYGKKPTVRDLIRWARYK